MHRYIVRRLLYMVPILLGISFITFFVMELAPGDALSEMRLNPNFTPEMIEVLRVQWGLDRPAWERYIIWVKHAFPNPWHWGIDFGRSLQFGAPAAHIIFRVALNTLILSAASILVAWLLAIPIGIHAARHQYSWSDKFLTTFSFMGISIPNFFLALCLLYLVVKFGIPLPIGGATSVGSEEWPFLARVWDRIRHLIIPTLVLGTAGMASLTRYMRSNLLDQLRQDYVTTARAKGLPEKAVVYKHAVRNAINPLITIFGFEIGGVLSGAALTEIVANYPGLGRTGLSAVLSRDNTVVMGVLMISSVLLMLGNLIADILLAWSDPRIRYD